MIFEHRAPHGGREGGDVTLLLALSNRSGGIAAKRWILPRAGGVRGGRRCRLGRSRWSRRGCRFVVDPRDDRTDRDRIPFLDQLFGQYPSDRRRHFDADLVGFEAGDRLIL